MKLLSVEGLTVELPTGSGPLSAVRGVSLEVKRGETLGIVGESGCGKSMTALSLLGLTPPGAKVAMTRYEFEKTDVLGRHGVKSLRGARIGMIFQEPMTALNPVFPIGSQLTAVYRRHKGGTRAAARERAVALLERVGISNAAARLGQYPHQLSGGLRQRVMIAMALMCDPALIIADEPTTALDVTIQMQILQLLQDVRTSFGTGLILITHDLGVVSHVADRIAVMYAGQVVETGSTASILSSPRHPYTAGLLGSLPQPGRHEPGSPLATIPGMVPSLIHPPQSCAFSDRCPRALPRCGAAMPPLKIDGPGREVRCVNPEPLGWIA
ncbi:ABC transporter ATP-binding protein [Acuticoccus sp. I52.16.1]|uniref:ABC transporter ATP-binding protein n=1 Tax=Acuticoccus sp. I52.16.1 TaxID=2928472 RepID=UPI001FD264A6|nr:ABC transporter ATP-binding protein [Acuticoccus sp. I52.16.1]UOM35625.1 ABC transporter ATP-binding protein [Acuticoccus sp. I52.16.1]